MRHSEPGVFRGSGYAAATTPLLSVGVTYRTATDAHSRRRHLDGGPSPFRAPGTAVDEATEEPQHESTPPADLPPARLDADRGRRTADRYDIPLQGPTRAERRRAEAGAAAARAAAVTAPPGRTGRALSPQRRVAQARANSRSWLRILATIAGIALLATCAAGTFFLLRDGTHTPNEADAAGNAPAPAQPGPDPLDSRATDPEPLTRAELFPETGVVTGTGTYEVVKTEALDKCAAAATGELAKLLTQRVCTQVVRATLISPDGAYAVTAGAANLLDAEGAQAVRAGIEKDAGDFTTLPGDDRTAALGQKSTVLGYNTYGHYLLYVVMAPTGRKATDQGDPAYQAIVGDIVETHLAQALRPRRG